MSLKDLLLARIAQDGPLSVADYMAECLLHPTYGYYATRDVFGAEGDFITAPEISQMFGELVGLALAQAWLDQGAPPAPVLAELGPGRGTLMRDALRAMKAVPGLAPRIHLIEASPALRAVQKDTLAGHAVAWADSVADLPDGPLLLVANEFFDALPIRQYRRTETGWDELRIGASEGRLTRGFAPAGQVTALAHRLEDTAPGDIVETCAPARPIASDIAARIAAHGGAALIADYGDWRSLGDTWQALRAHKTADPLEAPGDADLTAHVDFEPLVETVRAAGARPSRLSPQGVFLERLGITPRAQTLAKALSGPALEAHIAAHRRLTHPEEMGNLFKVMGIVPDGAPMLAGLEG